MSSPGRLIVLEGTDDAALGVQLERLYRWLQREGLPVERTGAPTRGPVGALLRLHGQGRLQFDATTLALLWMADQMDHLGREDGVRAWLRQGRVVLCARYVLYAMAVMADQVEMDWLGQINARCPRPDLTLFLKPDPAEPADPLSGRYDRALAAAQRAEAPAVRVPWQRAGDRVEVSCREHIAALLWPEGEH